MEETGEPAGRKIPAVGIVSQETVSCVYCIRVSTVMVKHFVINS